MSPKDLPAAYLKKSRSRLKALRVLYDDRSFSDVVRESQEIVELCSKGILRIALIDPPHRHDVAEELCEAKNALPKSHHETLDELATANHWLRREREMAFYGADDFDPTEGYSLHDADRALGCAQLAVGLLSKLASPPVKPARRKKRGRERAAR
jgi:HEPN domain-containing protein